MKYRRFQAVLLCAFLILLHSKINTTNGVHSSGQAIVHTYVPPLTHAPGLGLSMIGTHGTPPFTILESLHTQLSQTEHRNLDNLRRQHHLLIDKGVAHRIRMQELTVQLTNNLPEDVVHQAWLNRLQNEIRLGELNVWERLIKQRTSSVVSP